MTPGISDLEMTPQELRQRIDRGDTLLLVDVREPWEHELCHIEGAKLVPLGSLAASLSSLLGAEEVICYCHHGLRSLDAAAWLRFQGVQKAKSLAGGIERWSIEVDPKVPRY
jgi:rhodanese-related sulfurtransferase